jgi:hypothetical protein
MCEKVNTYTHARMPHFYFECSHRKIGGSLAVGLDTFVYLYN